MNAAVLTPPSELRCGDYVTKFPIERDGDRELARQLMRRNGCRSMRFETLPAGTLVAHGYVARMDGQGVEAL